MLTIVVMFSFLNGASGITGVGLDICRGIVTVTDNSTRLKVAANGNAVTVTDNSTRLDVCG